MVVQVVGVSHSSHLKVGDGIGCIATCVCVGVWGHRVSLGLDCRHVVIVEGCPVW